MLYRTGDIHLRTSTEAIIHDTKASDVNFFASRKAQKTKMIPAIGRYAIVMGEIPETNEIEATKNSNPGTDDKSMLP
jgi:hypothetical protein